MSSVCAVLPLYQMNASAPPFLYELLSLGNFLLIDVINCGNKPLGSMLSGRCEEFIRLHYEEGQEGFRLLLIEGARRTLAEPGRIQRRPQHRGTDAMVYRMAVHERSESSGLVNADDAGQQSLCQGDDEIQRVREAADDCYKQRQNNRCQQIGLADRCAFLELLILMHLDKFVDLILDFAFCINLLILFEDRFKRNRETKWPAGTLRHFSVTTSIFSFVYTPMGVIYHIQIPI